MNSEEIDDYLQSYDEIRKAAFTEIAYFLIRALYESQRDGSDLEESILRIIDDLKKSVKDGQAIK